MKEEEALANCDGEGYEWCRADDLYDAGPLFVRTLIIEIHRFPFAPSHRGAVRHRHGNDYSRYCHPCEVDIKILGWLASNATDPHKPAHKSYQ